MIPVLVMALAGGLGAACRFALDGAVQARSRSAVPVGTLVVNVSGSLALGLLTGWLSATGTGGPWGLVLGTGFLGGYTTFSTAMVEAARLVLAGRPRAGFGLAAGTWAACVTSAALGVAAGMTILT